MSQASILLRTRTRGMVGLADDVHQEAIAAAARFAGVHDHGHDVHFPQRVERGIDHPDVQPMERLVDAGGVQVDDLAGGTLADPDDPVPRRLRLVRDDRELLADEAVEQRRLAGVGPADEGHEAALHRIGGPALGGSRRLRAAHADAGDAAALGLQHFHVQAVNLERLAHRRARAPGARAGSRPRSRSPAPRLPPSAGWSCPPRARLPLKTNRPWPSSTMRSTSTSYSSRISPTISSRRSSMVTRPAVLPYSSTTIALWTRLRWNSFSSSGTRLVSGTKCAGRISVVTTSDEDALGLSWIRSLTNTKPEDVVERLLVDGDARVLLLAKHGQQLIERGLGLDADDVGPGRHHFAHHGLAEIDERAQQLAGLPFLPRFGFGHGRRGMRRAARDGLIAVRPLPPRAGPEAQERAGQRMQHARRHVERRQQHVEDPLGIRADDQQRHDLLAYQPEGNHREDQHGKAGRLRRP